MWYPSAGSACTRIPHHQQPIPLLQPALGYHITNSQSRYITPTRLKSAHFSLHNNAPNSRKFLKMDVLTSETCWTVNWYNKASVIKLVYLYSNIKMMHGPICIRKKDLTLLVEEQRLWSFALSECQQQLAIYPFRCRHILLGALFLNVANVMMKIYPSLFPTAFLCV